LLLLLQGLLLVGVWGKREKEEREKKKRARSRLKSERASKKKKKKKKEALSQCAFGLLAREPLSLSISLSVSLSLSLGVPNCVGADAPFILRILPRRAGEQQKQPGRERERGAAWHFWSQRSPSSRRYFPGAPREGRAAFFVGFF